MLGAFFRIINRTPYKYYPDAYQNLLVAENITTYHGVVGKLGPMGMPYPPFAPWTRPFYPLLIAGASSLGLDPARAATGIALMAGTLAIPAAFFAVRALAHSVPAGMFAALLLAVSFNHVVWSGAILTESIGVLLTLVVLWRIGATMGRDHKLGNTDDYITGIIFALSVLTRYEYIVLSVPLLYMIASRVKHPLPRVITFLSGMLLTLTICITILFPVNELVAALRNDVTRLAVAAGGTGAIIVGLFWLTKSGYAKKSIVLIRCAQSAVWAIAAIVVMQIFIPYFPYFVPELKAVRNFSGNDMMIVLSFLLGITLFSPQTIRRELFLFVTGSLLILYVTYYQVNPGMERYMTHLLPFLLIPASLGLAGAISHGQYKKKTIVLITVASIFVWQSYLSARGFSALHDPTWRQPSYEESSARILQGLKKDDVSMAIVALPEPYYYFTGMSVHSVADRYPYIYIDAAYDNLPVYVVDDLAMRAIFPNFTRHIRTLPRSSVAFGYRVGKPFHYLAKTISEQDPVTVYRTTVGNLKKLPEIQR